MFSDSDATFIGAMAGAKEVVEKYEKALQEANNNIDNHVVMVNVYEASANAYRRLAEEIMSELKDPKKPARFSDPENIDYRKTFVESVYEYELQRIKKQNENDGLVETQKQRDFEKSMSQKMTQKFTDMKF